MSNNREVDTAYSCFWPRIYKDIDFKQLDIYQRAYFIFSFTAMEAASDSNFGIFEVDIEDIGKACCLNSSDPEELKKIDAIIDFFNFEKPKMVGYDRKSSIMFCKNWPNFQRTYLSSYSSYIPKLNSDWRATRHKVPHFWEEFYSRNKEKILRMNHEALEAIIQNLKKKEIMIKENEENKKKKKKTEIIQTLEEFIAVTSKDPTAMNQYRRSLKLGSQLDLFEKNNDLENEVRGYGGGGV